MLDMTLSAITKVTSDKGSNSLKRLNDFERETGKILKLNLDLLQREDLSMSAVAKSKLLQKINDEFSSKEKASLWSQYMAILDGDKAATKFKVRNIALSDELGRDLYNVERSLDENRDNKRMEKRRRRLKAGSKN